jgi:proteic killer suppression protein
VISGFRDAWLHEFYVNGTGHRLIPAAIEGSLARKLDIIRFAATEDDVRIPPGNRFEHLNVKLAAFCSIRINRQYRLISRWSDGKASDVYLDPHTYR